MVKIRKIITVVLEWYIVSIFGYLQFILPKMNKLNFWVAESIILIISLASGLGIHFLLNNYEFKEPERSKLTLKIEYGDLFNKKYKDKIRVIPVDSDLNRNTDCRIRSKSIQAQFMDKFRDVDLPTITDSDGKMVCFNQKYYLFRVAKFNADHHIELESYQKYFELIYDLCKELDNSNGEREFVCSVIGGNIRFANHQSISYMQRLQLLKLAIETYNFLQEINITIVVRRDWKNLRKYNLKTI